MTHRAEQIMARVEVLLTGLTTTADKVFRGRTLPLGRDDDLPCWLVFMGNDIPEDVHTPDDLIVNLEVFLDAVAASSGQVETILNQMRQEATAALAADYRIGLSDFVQQIQWLGSEAPEIDGEGDRAMMRQRSLWQVTYERSRTDPSS